MCDVPQGKEAPALWSIQVSTARARTDEHRRDADVELINEGGPDELSGEIGPANDPHVPAMREWADASSRPDS